MKIIKYIIINMLQKHIVNVSNITETFQLRSRSVK